MISFLAIATSFHRSLSQACVKFNLEQSEMRDVLQQSQLWDENSQLSCLFLKPGGGYKLQPVHTKSQGFLKHCIYKFTINET